jgi:ribosomal protein S18 acetylase RimI-like enzyme
VSILKKIAGQSYIHSRYYFDEHFPRKRCQEFYTEWIEKSCGGYVEQVLVAELSGTVVGYITCRLVNRFEGSIELVGVDPAAAGNSIGRSLVGEALQWFRSRGIKTVEVVTQGRNYAAQRLYQRCGFVTKKTELWYHKWFNASA